MKIDSEKLLNAVKHNEPGYIYKLKFGVEVVFDVSVSENKQALIEGEIKYAMKIDGKDRSLAISKAEIDKLRLLQDPSKDIEIETLKLSEEKVQIEMQRLQLETTKEKSELENQIKDRDKKLTDQIELEKANREKSPIHLIKEFQLIVLAVVVGLVLVFIAFVVSFFRKKDMGLLSSTIEKVGEMLQSSEGGKQVESAAEAVPEAAVEGPVVVAEQQGAGSSADAERYQEFLSLVEEKIEVLSKEGNYAFYRHFIDIINNTPILGAAILVSVNPDTSKILVENISQLHIDQIKNTLAEDGAISKAQSMRGAALEEFFGKISLDEFTESPLLKINNISWLTRLTNVDLQNLALELGGAERTKFLANFTSHRLVAILDASTSPENRDKLIDSVKGVDEVTEEKIDECFQNAKETWEKLNQSQVEQVKKLIDGPRFFANMIQNLKGESKNKLLEVLSERDELMSEIKNYYIPFDTIEKMSLDTVKTVFAKRPTVQTAMIIFSSGEAVRNTVIRAMPEMLQDTLKEELESLDGDKSKEAFNRNKSFTLQDEVCLLFLKLNKEGLLSYSDSEGETTTDESSDQAA